MAKRGGKYDKILPGLKPAPVLDPAEQLHQSRVDEEKDRQRGDRISAHCVMVVGKEPAGPPLSSLETDLLARLYAYHRAEEERLALIVKQNDLTLSALEQLLVLRQEMQSGDWGRYGVKSNALRLASGQTIRIQAEPIGQVTDREAFRRWCLRNGYELKLQLWPSTMNAIVKERALAGDPLPDGTDVFSRTKVVFVDNNDES